MLEMIELSQEIHCRISGIYAILIESSHGWQEQPIHLHVNQRKMWVLLTDLERTFRKGPDKFTFCRFGISKSKTILITMILSKTTWRGSLKLSHSELRITDKLGRSRL